MAHLERFVAFSMLCEESCKSLQRIKAAYMNKLGLQSGAALLLAVLCRHKDGLSAAALARACKLDRAAVSRAIPPLLEKGVIAYREEHPEKRNYRSPLVITEVGARTVEQIHRYTVDAVRRISGDIEGEELAAFYRVFRTLERRLSEHEEELERASEERKDP